MLKNKQENNLVQVDSVLKITSSQINEISDNVKSLISEPDDNQIRLYVGNITNLENDFLLNMEKITNWLQEESERKNRLAVNICYILTAIALIIILIEFFLVILPSQKDLREKNNNLVIANKQLSDFAQITAHNLRAPIGNLIFLSNFYRDAESDEERNELFVKFNTVIKHLDETINVLLDGLKIKTKNEIHTQKLNFNDILSHTKDLLVGEIIETNAVITSDFSSAPFINYNKIYMDSIMLNLVGNALKYRDDNRSTQIHIKTENTKNFIKLYVEDNGLGIDLERQGKKIFGLHQTFHRNKNSKGIGLFMTKNQIQSMGGSIDVHSIPDKGSTFIVTFKK